MAVDASVPPLPPTSTPTYRTQAQSWT